MRKAGFDLQEKDPNLIQFFTTSHEELPQQSSSEELIQQRYEIPTQYIGNTKLSRKSKFRFYALGTQARNSSEKSHHYDKFNYVFVTVGNASSRKLGDNKLEADLGTKINSLPFVLHKEEEKFNLVESGREWYGDFINTEYFQNLSLDSYEQGTEIELSLRMISTASSEKRMVLSESNKTIGTSSLPRSFHDRNDQFRRYNRIGNEVFSRFYFTPSSDQLKLKWLVEEPDSFQDGAYLDNYSLTYNRRIEPGNDQWSAVFTKEGLENSYSFTTNNDLKIWDVGNPIAPILIPNGSFNFENRIATELRFFREDQIYKPLKIEKETLEELPNLAGVNHIIISPEHFESAANTLAEYRNSQGDLKSTVVNLETIYNTYSGGKVDPTAIRNFLRQIYEREPKNLKYALLIGDASFDFKNNQGLDFVNIDNYIPSYQSRESLEPIYSFSSDDYYGFLDPEEGFWPEGTSEFNSWRSTTDTTHKLDIAIGRLPAKTLLEAYNAVEKIIDYESESNHKGDWRNKVLFVADDADFNIHLRDAERFSSQISQINPSIEVEKLYLDSFEQKVVGSSKISEGAKNELDRSINDGVFIINYNGHGSELGWTDEKLLTLGQIQRWNNSTKLPIFFTATCEYGKYDNPARVSGAELSLLQANTGAIALLTTTRPVFASTNFTINKAFYDELYSNSDDRLGDIFRRTKNASIRGEINRNFTLLGDPALRLPGLNKKVKINKIQVSNSDSLVWSTGSKVILDGEIENYQGDGKITAKAYFPEKRKVTLGDGANPAPFQDYEEKIFNGVQNISNGIFNFEFTIPSLEVDSTKFGKIFFYALSQDSTQEFVGEMSNFKIREGEVNNSDLEGPQIEMLSQNSRDLLLRFEDLNGLDPNSLAITINDTLSINTKAGFYSEFGFETSIFETVLSTLPLGIHKIDVSASDNYNNESTESFLITLASTPTQVIKVKAYPNPTSELFRVNFRHNALNENLNFVLNIYDMKGQKLITERRDCYICTSEVEIGTNLGQNLHVNGAYWYQLITTNIDNQETTASAGQFLFWK